MSPKVLRTDLSREVALRGQKGHTRARNRSNLLSNDGIVLLSIYTEVMKKRRLAELSDAKNDVEEDTIRDLCCEGKGNLKGFQLLSP